jgi:hypothetical protein
MIGSVSSGFRRRRRRNATKPTIAATASPAASRQARPAGAAVGGICVFGSSNTRRATPTAWPTGWSWPVSAAARGPRDRNFGSAAATPKATVAALEGAGVVDWEVCGRIVGVSAFAILGSTRDAARGGSICPEFSALLRCTSLLGPLATAGCASAVVAAGAAVAVSRAGLTTGSTAGAAPGEVSDAGAVAARSPEPAMSAVAGAAASTAGVDATRGGSRVSGST